MKTADFLQNLILYRMGSSENFQQLHKTSKIDF